MANYTELAQRLLKRFKGVPNISNDDADDWVEDAMLEHGYSLSDAVPSEKVSLILLYAQAEGATQIALATAHFFTYTDGEEQVDKSKVSQQYRRLAQDLRNEYERKKASKSGAAVRFIRRADRI
jgi:hypothetical protein